jgi:hypothetical protein
MSRCTNCSGYTYKVHRTLLERLVFASAHACLDCDFRLRKSRWSFSAFRFVFSTSTACPRCGIRQVDRAVKKDRIAEVSRHPLSLLQQIFRAPRMRCSACRLYYHDLRSVRGAGVIELPKPVYGSSPRGKATAHFTTVSDGKTRTTQTT